MQLSSRFSALNSLAGILFELDFILLIEFDITTYFVYYYYYYYYYYYTVKVQFTLEQATKAQRGSIVIDLLFL